MTTRIDRRFAVLKDEGRAALVTFLMAGDPDYEISLAIVKALPEAGADLIELGMPFTDPMADGPAIQAAGLRALKAGQNMKRTLALVREFRRGDDATPIVLMGYYNPIYVYGVEQFLTDAKSAGVDGLIVVDLPPEEDTELCLPALKAGFNFIRLATPTTDDKRLPAVLANTSGFVYYVSVTGITGSAAPDTGKVAEAVKRIKRRTELPVCVGFGVRTAEQARAIAKGADGVVVGSALVDTVRSNLGADGTATPATVAAVADSSARSPKAYAARAVSWRPAEIVSVVPNPDMMPNPDMARDQISLGERPLPAQCACVRVHILPMHRSPCRRCAVFDRTLPADACCRVRTSDAMLA